MRYITGAFCERGLILKRLSAILLHNFKIFHHYGRKKSIEAYSFSEGGWKKCNYFRKLCTY